MTNESKAALKGGRLFALLALIILLLFFLIWQFCGGGKGGPVVEVREAIKAPRGVAFIDVNGLNKNVTNVKVTILDPGKMVVSSNGIPFTTVGLSEGFMSIGLSSKASFGMDTPYRFYIRAEADGYMTNIHPVVIAKDEPGYIPIYMASLKSLPPSGLAAEQSSITAVENGVLQRADTLRAVPTWGNLPPVSIALEKGTEFLCNGQRVTSPGALSYRLVYGAPRDSNANRVFPGGFEVPDAFDETGKIIARPSDPFFFTTVGWFSMEMNIGNEGVNEFSKPLMVEMPVDKNVIDPKDGEPLQVGDTLPIWSMNNNVGAWKRELLAVVTDAGDGMKVRFPISHLSYWNIDLPGLKCGATINITYTQPASNFGGDHFTEFIDVSSPSTGIYLKSESILFDPVVAPSQNTQALVRIPSAGTYKLLIHNGADQGSPISHVSDNFGCSDAAGKFIRPFNVPGAACINLEFTQSGGTPILCNNSFWHKNDAPEILLFTYAGVIQGGNLTIPSGLGPQIVNLWFYDANTSQQSVISFVVDFGMLPGSDALTYTYRIGGVLQPVPASSRINVSRVNTVPVAACPAATFTFTLPNDISGTGACPEPD